MSDLLEFAPCGYIRFSDIGTIERINSTLANWIGAPKQAIEGQLIQSLLPKAGQIFLQSYIFPQLKFSADLEECHFKLLARSGERIPVLGNFYWSERARSDAPQLDGTKTLYDVIIIRAHKRHELENALVLAQQRADAAICDLQKSNDSLSRFANMVAHDLKSPLRNIDRLAGYLLEDYEDVLDRGGKDLLQKLGSNSQRAIYFVEKLLEYGSLGAKGTALAAVDLHEVVTIASETLSESMAATGTTLQIGRLPTVMGIDTQLVQLFQNLIGNAIKYRSSDRAPIIDIEATQIGEKEWKIWVKDNGLGIPAQHQQDIFDILFRLRKDREGAGIGLATCKWIVQNHLGNIGVESNVDAGSRFYFTLRAADR